MNIHRRGQATMLTMCGAVIVLFALALGASVGHRAAARPPCLDPHPCVASFRVPPRGRINWTSTERLGRTILVETFVDGQAQEARPFSGCGRRYLVPRVQVVTSSCDASRQLQVAVASTRATPTRVLIAYGRP